jgi:glycosyltransferase involved in cell wall biosynthesis
VNVKATVIIPTYNRPHLLERSLRALLAQDPSTPAYEVVVVDDCSRSDVGALIAKLAGANQRVTYLRHSVNRGLSATRNTGVRHAQGDVILFVDDDVVVEPGYVAAHLRAHETAGSERVAVVGNLRFPPQVVAASNYARYLQSRYLGGREPEVLAGLRPSDLHPRFLIGAVCSMRRDDLLAVGMYNETMRFYGCDDHIFAQALKRAGVRIIFAPEARALHWDSVAVSWYRAKMQETARDGIPVLVQHAPEFLEETGFADLLPVDWSRDRPTRIVRKLVIRAALNPLALRALEAWSTATDRIGWLYVPAVGRALSAGWFLQGLGMAANGPRLVVYGS